MCGTVRFKLMSLLTRQRTCPKSRRRWFNRFISALFSSSSAWTTCLRDCSFIAELSCSRRSNNVRAYSRFYANISTIKSHLALGTYRPDA